PLDSPSLLGKKWSAFHPNWYRSDGHAQYYARELNRRFDRIIKRALENNWTHIGLQMGLVGKIDGDPVIVRALNHRIQQLSMPGKESDRAIRTIGFHPERVRDQLRNLSAHAGHIDDIMEALQPSTPPAVP